MSQLTPDVVNSIVDAYREKSPIVLDYNNFTVTVKPYLTVDQKNEFVERVIAATYPDRISPSYTYSNTAFTITFMQMCTNIPMPVLENDPTSIDVQKAIDVADSLDLIPSFISLCKTPYTYELREIVERRIEFENARIIAMYSGSSANDEAIEAVSAMAYQGLELMNKGIGFLEENKDKLDKILTPKKINAFLNKLQKTIEGMAGESSESKNTKASSPSETGTNITKMPKTWRKN